jgi:DNA polymerase (family 10)
MRIHRRRISAIREVRAAGRPGAAPPLAAALRPFCPVAPSPARQHRPEPVTNREIANALLEMSLFLEMEDVPFKPRAYEKAAHAIETMGPSVAELFRTGGCKALDAIPGVGKSIAAKVEELVTSGRIRELESYRRKVPVDLLALTSVEGVGPKAARALYEALGVRTVADLQAAAAAGKIHGVPHFGERSEHKILESIGFLAQAGGRVPLGRPAELVGSIEERLRRLPGVEEAAVAGSVRRRKETIGDIDFLVAARRPAAVMEAFAAMPEVARVYGKGPTKTLVRLRTGIDADLRIVPHESFGAALQYFTGSKDHNIALRRLAQGRGLKLSEYGLFRGARRIAGKTEAEVYEALGLEWIPPELRENAGEIEAARAGTLPRLVECGDLQGDLQVQTSWTDGDDTIEAMVAAARRLGWKYIAITDHTRDLAMTGGADAAKLRAQAAAIRKLDAKLRGFTVLAGAEVNIRKDGTLDIDDETLAGLDLVGAAIHSHFSLPRAEMTARLVRAMESPHVDVLFHPTARSLGRRPAVDVDMDALIAAARRTGTLLEIDGQPDRLDLGDEHARRAIEAGVKIAVDSDAHRASELRYAIDFGVAVARRAWARKQDVVNTRSLEQLRRCLKRNRR